MNARELSEDILANQKKTEFEAKDWGERIVQLAKAVVGLDSYAETQHAKYIKEELERLGAPSSVDDISIYNYAQMARKRAGTIG